MVARILQLLELLCVTELCLHAEVEQRGGKVFMLHVWRPEHCCMSLRQLLLSRRTKPFYERCFVFPSTYIKFNQLKPLYWVAL